MNTTTSQLSENVSNVDQLIKSTEMATSDTSQCITEEVTLRQAVKAVEFDFPVILKTKGSYEEYEILNPELNEHLPVNSLLMLESQVNIPYVHVKILALENEAETIKLKGEDYVKEYNQLVGQEFLIPVKIKNKVKIIHRPGQTRRFTNITAVLECLPRYLMVGANTKATDPETGELITVPKGITLEVIKHFRVSDLPFLECTGSNRKLYWFSDDAVVNFTEVDDMKSYSLSQIASKMLLPKVVKFESSISPDDVVVYNDTWAYNTMVMTYGAIEVIGTKRKYNLIGWLRAKNRGIVSFRRVLLPITQWDKEIVQFRNFTTIEEIDTFCQKKFKMCRNSADYENKLYIIPLRSNGITYLRSDQTFYTGCDNDSSDDSDDYEKPMASQGPAVPPRRPIRRLSDESASSTESVPLPKRTVRPDVLQRVIEKARLGFKFVHKELKHSFLTKQNAQKLATENAETPTAAAAQSHESSTVDPSPPLQRLYSKPSKIKQTESGKPTPPPKPRPSSPNPRPRSPKPHQSSAIVYSRSPNPRPSSPKHCPPTKPKPKPKLSTPNEDTYPLKIPMRPPKSSALLSEQISENSKQTEPTRYSQLPRSSSKTKKTTITDDDQPQVKPNPDRPPAPLPEQVANDCDHEYDYPVFNEFMQGVVPQKLTVAEIQKITRKNQTARDFGSYSVQQVAGCFALCALKGLGNVCLENKVDGAFLESFELEHLKEEPFLLSDFQIQKVKLIIQKGWRPALGSS